MKQADGNPWDDVEQRFPPGTVVEGEVRNLTSYGAFVEIEEGIDGLLHVSDMSWTRKITNPAEVVDKGQKIKAVVLSVHPDKKRISLGMKQLELDPWQGHIRERFAPESEHVGVVTKVTNFGIFVRLDEDLEGLLHISELTPADHLAAGQRAAVRVLRLDPEERKIGLTLVRGDRADEMIASAPHDEGADAAAKAAVAEAEAEQAVASFEQGGDAGGSAGSEDGGDAEGR
jgi:small subunit ribosomal protein S1